MATLKIDDATARKIYPAAAPELKAILEKSYSPEFFSMKITDRIKTVDDAFEACGIDKSKFLLDSDTKDEKGYKTAKVICMALNEGWTPDWNNSSQYKYYPWFYMDGSGFRCGDCVSCYLGSSVGSRLCFRSSELAEYAGKQFVDVYRDFMTL